MAEDMECLHEHEFLLAEKMDFDFQKLKRAHEVSGFREGVSAGEESFLQQGFNLGFTQHASLNKTCAKLRGILSAVLSMKHSQKVGEEIENSTVTQVQNILDEITVLEQQGTGQLNTDFSQTVDKPDVTHTHKSPTAQEIDIDELNTIMNSVGLTTDKHVATETEHENLENTKPCDGHLVAKETELFVNKTNQGCSCQSQSESKYVSMETGIQEFNSSCTDSRNSCQCQPNVTISDNQMNANSSCVKECDCSSTRKWTPCFEDKFVQIRTKIETFLVQNGFDKILVKDLLYE